jgi:hypothetical protein
MHGIRRGSRPVVPWPGVDGVRLRANTSPGYPWENSSVPRDGPPNARLPWLWLVPVRAGLRGGGGVSAVRGRAALSARRPRPALEGLASEPGGAPGGGVVAGDVASVPAPGVFAPLPPEALRTPAPGRPGPGRSARGAALRMGRAGCGAPPSGTPAEAEEVVSRGAVGVARGASARGGGGQVGDPPGPRGRVAQAVQDRAVDLGGAAARSCPALDRGACDPARPPAWGVPAAPLRREVGEGPERPRTSPPAAGRATRARLRRGVPAGGAGPARGGGARPRGATPPPGVDATRASVGGDSPAAGRPGERSPAGYCSLGALRPRGWLPAVRPPDAPGGCVLPGAPVSRRERSRFRGPVIAATRPAAGRSGARPSGAAGGGGSLREAGIRRPGPPQPQRRPRPQ